MNPPSPTDGDPRDQAAFAANRGSAWRIVAIATVVQNAGPALAFSAFGTMVLAIERTYHGDRQSSSTALAAMLFSLLVTSAAAARLVERAPIRAVMIAGVLVASAGYALASVASGIYGVVACYGLLIGPGAALFGPLTCNTLVTRWMRGGPQGRALGVVSMPIFAVLAPLVLQPLLNVYDVRVLLRGIAVALLCLTPLIALLRERPPYEPEAVQSGAPGAGTPLQVRVILGGGVFWMVCVSYGIAAGSASMRGAHLVPLLMDQGRTFSQASLFLATSGGAGVFGALIYGGLSDRIGPAAALAINCLTQALTMTLLLIPFPMPTSLLIAILGGACGSGILAPFAMLLVRIYGGASYPRAYGLASLATLPFIFAMPPFAGALYVRTHSYVEPFAITVGALLAAVLLLGGVHTLRRRYPTAKTAAAVALMAA